MENKELPTIQEYMMTYLENQPLFPKYDRWIDFAFNCPLPTLISHYESVMEEYAQLVAEYHVKEERKNNDIVLKELKENLFQIRNLINS